MLENFVKHILNKSNEKAMIAFKTICVMAFFIPNWLFASVLVGYCYGDFAGRIYSVLSGSGMFYLFLLVLGNIIVGEENEHGRSD